MIKFKTNYQELSFIMLCYGKTLDDGKTLKELKDLFRIKKFIESKYMEDISKSIKKGKDDCDIFSEENKVLNTDNNDTIKEKKDRVANKLSLYEKQLDALVKEEILLELDDNDAHTFLDVVSNIKPAYVESREEDKNFIISLLADFYNRLETSISNNNKNGKK